MPQYVYGLHDFEPENADEVPFKVGDRIEVLEKDDLYQDGWWTGRNPQGKSGLFPQSYTSPTPPVPTPSVAIHEPQPQLPTSSYSPPSMSSSQLPSTSPDSTPAANMNSSLPAITLHTLAEEPESHDATPDARDLINQGDAGYQGDVEMMRATMTDVQQAIEQLGRSHNDRDGSRSFSFASSHGDYTDREGTETENDDTDAERDDHADDGPLSWHRSARERLAERARLENEERAREEEVPDTPMRSTAPPIDVELSDESDDDEDHPPSRRSSAGAKRISDPPRSPRYPHIPEEPEEEKPEEKLEDSHQQPLNAPISAVVVAIPDKPSSPLTPAELSAHTTPPSVVSTTTESGAHIIPSEDFIVPMTEESSVPTTATPERTIFNTAPSRLAAASVPLPASPAAIEATSSSNSNMTNMSTPMASPMPLKFPEPDAPGTPGVQEIPAMPSPSLHSVFAHSPAPGQAQVLTAPSMKNAPSAIRVAEQSSYAGVPAMPSPSLSSTGSVGVGSIHQTLTPATTLNSFRTPQIGTPPPGHGKRSPQDSNKSPSHLLSPSTTNTTTTHPSEWSVEEVIDWLKSKGFDQGVCDKFIEQEITGDVLLELDANILKSEIGILAFGKRIRIVNAISELKRPPSISESEQMGSASSPGGIGLGIGGMSGMTGMGGLQALQGLQGVGMGSPAPQISASRSHSITYSHSHSASMQSSTHHSFTNNPSQQQPVSLAFPIPQSLSPALSNSLSMPGNVGAGGSVGVGGGLPSAGLGSMLSNESDFASVPQSAGAGSGHARNGWRASDPGSIHHSVLGGIGGTEEKEADLRREGSVNGKSKGRLASPSDGALKATAFAERSLASVAPEERSGFSDSETTQASDPKSKRRRLFGLSAESSLKEKASSIRELSTGRSSKDLAPTLSHDDALPLPTRRHSKKKSTDERKASDRLSLFGATFSPSLGKSRKPAPRLSSSNEGERERTTSSAFATLSRIRHVGDRKASSKSTDLSRHTSKDHRDKDTKHDKTNGQNHDNHDSEKGKQKEHMRPSVLRKRTVSSAEASSVRLSPTALQTSISASNGIGGSVAGAAVVGGIPVAGGTTLKAGESILEQIGTPDHNGWMRKKGDHYNTWKLRYFVLKGSHLYCLRSNSPTETKIKGYINILGYRVYADENVDPGRYGFRIVHDTDKTHYFSSEEHSVIREWMKAMMKATITRDYTSPVASSSNIPTIPLVVAQAMNPAPRPPSPGAREATQRAHRRDNPNQLSSRDAQILLMGLPAAGKDVNKSPTASTMTSNGNGQIERARLESFFTNDSASITAQDQSPRKLAGFNTSKVSAPPRPSRETRRFSTNADSPQGLVDTGLIEWANSHLPPTLHITDPLGPLCGGLALLRMAEDIKGSPSSPPVPDSAFPSGPNDDRLDGLFRLFDFLLDNDVKMGTVSINDVRQGKKEKIVQLLRALKAWEDKRKAIAQSLGKSTIVAGPFMGMAGPIEFY